MANPAPAPSLRLATPADAEPIAALAIQVFLDTYAIAGVRPDLAREAFTEYSTTAFTQRLNKPGRVLHLAEQAHAGLIGFAEVQCTPTASPIAGVTGAELIRLYVQPQAQGRGIGPTLLRAAEDSASRAGRAGLWLSAWEHNARALAFYPLQGYVDVGGADCVIQGQAFGNRIFFRRLAG